MDIAYPQALVEDPIEKLKTSLYTLAISATPIALAVLGWIIGRAVTEPSIEELHTTADGSVMVRYSDETTAKTLCSLPDFLGQVRQLCLELDLTTEQAERAVTLVQKRLA